MREKLIDLAHDYFDSVPWYADIADLNPEELTDHLIANGVTIPVRCKDCKRAQQYEADHEVFCYFIGAYMGNNNFCSYGERRTDDRT